MNALNDKHPCDSGGEGESFRRGFLLRGDSVTSPYPGHIQNVSPKKDKCTDRILLIPKIQEMFKGKHC